MNRRDFLKLVGVVSVAPTILADLPPARAPKPKSPTGLDHTHFLVRLMDGHRPVEHLEPKVANAIIGPNGITIDDVTWSSVTTGRVTAVAVYSPDGKERFFYNLPSASYAQGGEFTVTGLEVLWEEG